MRFVATTSARKAVGASLMVFALAVGGCGGPAFVGVSGEVTFNGQPLSEGTIVFEPAAGTGGQRRDAKIENGRFTLPADQGMLPGQPFKVAIKAFRKTGRKYPNADMSASGDEVEQYLPKEYNTSTTLDVIISSDAAKNYFIFALVSGEK